ncbi:hypothetical protein F2Q69_00037325 [Brassica cretica]|uniref:Uncharacterized protein n=1 Tax=Brassica cretica TaxID=69181 RepID=A0A8S9SHM2_BRACR|nr:hypothetical protein F2Q69_00037325 [Brassica cretica]
MKENRRDKQLSELPRNVDHTQSWRRPDTHHLQNYSNRGDLKKGRTDMTETTTCKIQNLDLHLRRSQNLYTRKESDIKHLKHMNNQKVRQIH